MAEYTCRDCGASFTLPRHVADRYPGWTPRQCLRCRDGAQNATATATTRSRRNGDTGPRRRTRGGAKRVGSGVGALLTPEQVLERHHDGPQSGVFTDGGAVGNPGPGGWGAVYVVDGEIVAEASGHEPQTTNNRMELTAILAGIDMVPEGTPATIYSDSKYAVQALTEWAANWEKRGWRRKTGPVENLDLIKPAYETLRRRPELKLEWVPAHVGYRWNEYADALANRWRLEQA